MVPRGDGHASRWRCAGWAGVVALAAVVGAAAWLGLGVRGGSSRNGVRIVASWDLDAGREEMMVGDGGRVWKAETRHA